MLLVDTSVWSRAYRADADPADPLLDALRAHLVTGDVATTGLIYLELLRGFTRPSSRATIEKSFDSIPFFEPARPDFAAAADLAITCRRAGVQVATIDALIAQICIAHHLVLLTADADFHHAARHVPLDVWTPR